MKRCAIADGGFVLGIDGGSTGSRAVAVAMDGEVLLRVGGGPLNLYTSSGEVFRQNLGDLRSRVANGLPGRTCVHTTVGTATFLDYPSTAELRTATEGFPDSFTESLSLVGDAVVAGNGATAGAPGVLIIAGTGAIGIGFDANGDHAVRGGFGPYVGGDPGSAFWIASQAVIAAQDEPDLAGAICEHFEVAALTDLIPILYLGGFDSARLAGLSEALSRDPSPPWLLLEERAGRELAKLAGPLCAFVDEPLVSIFGCGSVLLNNPRVRTSLERELSQDIETPRLDAACGAALLALREAGALVASSLIDRIRGDV